MSLCLNPTKEVEGESSTIPNWLELPRDLTQNILHRLDVVEIVKSACLVCPLWWNICKEPIMWRTIDMRHTIDIWRNPLYTSISDFVKICKYAIDRSCGEIEDISIPCDGGSIDLLEYIADCASHLRRLGLVNCYEFSDEDLSEVAKKLPLLEELDISSSLPSRSTLEIFALYCPLLKSLKYSCSMYDHCEDDEAEAFAISKMSRLHCLELVGCLFTDDRLLAILEGCPHLESLNILPCFYFDLSGCLLKRCREQIRHFRPPFNRFRDLDDLLDFFDHSNGPYSSEFLDYNYGW